MIRVARIYGATGDAPGTRVLVDRLWPRGVSRADAALDEWCKQVAPSTELREWYRHDPGRFAEFAERYRRELGESERPGVVAHLRDLAARSGPLVLLTATKDLATSHAAVLAEYLDHPGDA